jgi:hypothetical protein
MDVQYRMLVDGRDVIRGDGSYVVGADIAVDGPTRMVASGMVRLPSDPERSDYPALNSETVRTSLLAGGLSGASGSIRVTQFEFASLFVPNDATHETYLVPSLVGVGERTKPDGSKGPFRIVVPLLAR